MSEITFSRHFAMPNAETFNVFPIRAFVLKYITGISIDLFARNQRFATYTNDMDLNTEADYHMDAEEFCDMLKMQNIMADVAIFDPPYSPRQISEIYKGIGKPVSEKDTQNAALYKRVRNSLDQLIKQNGIVLSFGWNSTGMGIKRGYELIEILLCAHGSAHNDTICIAERKLKEVPCLI